MKQVIIEATHILESFTRFKDLIYSKINLKIEYAPPYICKIWDYNRCETELIALLKFLICAIYYQVKMYMNKQNFFNKMLLNIFQNLIPNKVIICDDKDPPCINDEIKKLIRRKTWLFQCQRKSHYLDYAILNSIAQFITNVINLSKLKYHERLAS